MRKLDAEDRWAIVETLSLHGHIFDEGQLDRLEEIFTPEVVYDLRAAGVGTLDGCRISHRVIRPQRTPMNGAYIAGEAGGQS